MSKIIDLHQVDTFTDKIFGGNPAGVVTNADGLSDEQMLKIAREMNLSETAFVSTSTFPDADVKLRYFTPSCEVDFCGHATVGALYELAKLKMYGLGGHRQNAIRVETNIGALDMSVVLDDDNQPRVSFVAPAVKMEAYSLQGAAFVEKFGIPATSLKKDGKILIDRHLNYLYIPIASLKQLGELQFDFMRIRQQFADEKIVVFCLFTNQTMQAGSDLHTRGLAPLVGIEEDPFTGSMQAGLVQAAKENSLIGLRQQKVIVEQGDFIGRPGQAEVNFSINNNELSVTANAVQVFSTKMEV